MITEFIMKRFLPCILMLLLFAACSGKKQENPPENVPERDTLACTAAIDTPVVAETEPPRTADKLFDDFIYGFMKNKKFQLGRIKFPLANWVDGKNKPIAREAWKYDYMYSRQDIYTMIFNDEKSLDSEEDTSVHNVTVEWVYLEKERVKQYIFQKENGLWMLTALNQHALSRNENSDFYTFYRHFANDSTYQLSHIQDPFSFSTYDTDSFQDIEGVLDAAQWADFRPELPKDVITNINYGQVYRDTGRRILVVCSLSGGMNCKLEFHKKGKKWILVHLEN